MTVIDMKKPLSFSIPGALQILVERQKGSFELLSNIDGLRIDRAERCIHYVYFDGKEWKKAVMEDCNLCAVRSIRGNTSEFTSYSIEYCYIPSVSGLTLTGVIICTEFNGDPQQIHCSLGETCGKQMIKEKTYFNAGKKTLHDMINICYDELLWQKETTGIIGDRIDSLLELLTLVVKRIA